MLRCASLRGSGWGAGPRVPCCIVAALTASLAVPGMLALRAEATPARPQSPDSGETVLHAQSVAEGPTIDGVLDEDIWDEAVPFDAFVQQVPDTGTPASERTVVRILFTDTKLYFGVWVYQTDVSTVLANELRYDQPQMHRQDDTIAIMLDTFHDHRNGYEFLFNALGTRGDWACTEEGRHWNRFWDPVWDVATKRNSDGWTAEVEIPFKSIRYRNDGGRWGINIRRAILHRNEWVHATAISPAYAHPDQGIGQLSAAADLYGLEGIKGGRSVEIKPYISVDSSAEVPGLDRSQSGFEPGVDLKYGFTPSLNLDLTYNTDFSQVEVDEQQINLTRFSLFFPEKRTFFQEGQGIFDFGVRNGAYRVLPFFSRRIGQEDGTPVPIDGGGRLTGKLGDYSVGVLGLRTAQEEPHVRNDFSAVRIKRDVLGRSSVGMLFTDRRSAGGDAANQVFGLDANVAFGARNKLDLFWVQSTNDQGLGSSSAYRAHLLLENDLLGFETDWMRVGDAFDPRVGFVQRRGMNRRYIKAQISPRLRRFGIRRVFLRTELDHVEDLEGSLETRIWKESLTLQSEGEDNLTFSWQTSDELIRQPFLVAGVLPVSPGSYGFDDWQLRIGTSQSRRLFANLRLRGGGFFEGSRTDVGADAFFKASRHLLVDAGYSNSSIRLPTGELDARLMRFRGTFAFNRQIWTAALVQWNSVSRELGVNARLRYTYRPGSDIYVVFNERAISPESAWLLRERSLIVKWIYLLRL